jgi:lysophospholipase L1-like esterase
MRHALRYELMRVGLTARRLHGSFSESTKDDSRWDTTAAICANIKKAAGSTPIVFVMLPAAYQVDETVGESYKTYQDKDDVDFDQVSRLMNPRLEAQGIVVVDLLQPFRDALKSGYPPTHGSHDTHFNENGHVLTAELVEPYLLELLRNGKAAEPQN